MLIVVVGFGDGVEVAGKTYKPLIGNEIPKTNKIAIKKYRNTITPQVTQTFNLSLRETHAAGNPTRTVKKMKVAIPPKNTSPKNKSVPILPSRTGSP